MNETIKYNDGEIELSVSVGKETIWLNQAQISELFETSTDNIGLHLKNIYKEKELDDNSTTEDFSVVRQEGKRTVKRTIKHYNLDAIICVGYRVSSYKATKFRQWATSILKNYITDGYVINSEKITNQRFRELENDVTALQLKVENISNSLEDKSLQQKQHIFYDGQIFDAYLFVSDIVKSAHTSIKLIDNYVDETTLILFSKRDANVSVTLYTKNISKQLELDVQKYNAQYPSIELRQFDLSHDRFLIIDEKIVYHFGASLKDLGKKWFAVSLLDTESFGLFSRIKESFK